MGKPEIISSKMVPSDHTSNDHLCDLLIKSAALYSGSSYLCTMKSKTSGGKYSGVMTVIFSSYAKWIDEP